MSKNDKKNEKVEKVEKVEKKEKIEELKLEVFEEDDYFEEFDEQGIYIKYL